MQPAPAMALPTTDEQPAEAEAQLMALPATDEQPADMVISAGTQRSRKRNTVLGIVGYWSTLRSRLEGLAQAARGRRVRLPRRQTRSALRDCCRSLLARSPSWRRGISGSATIRSSPCAELQLRLWLRPALDMMNVYRSIRIHCGCSCWPPSFSSQESAFTTLLAASPLSIAAVALFAQRLAGFPARAVVGIAALTASKSYVDYSAAGSNIP